MGNGTTEQEMNTRNLLYDRIPQSTCGPQTFNCSNNNAVYQSNNQCDTLNRK